MFLPEIELPQIAAAFCFSYIILPDSEKGNTYFEKQEEKFLYFPFSCQFSRLRTLTREKLCYKIKGVSGLNSRVHGYV